MSQNVKTVQKENSRKFLEELRANKTKVVHVDGHNSNEKHFVKAGQIRLAGEGRFLVLREKSEGWLVCQLGDYEHPAAESEIKTDTGDILLVWNSFPANGSAVYDTVLLGEMPAEVLEVANEFYDLYMSMRKIPDKFLVNTGEGSVWDTEELIQYMEHMSAKLGDFIIKALY